MGLFRTEILNKGGLILLDWIRGTEDEAQTPDLDFWGPNPPEAIVFCSSSNRKIVLLEKLLRRKFRDGETDPVRHQKTFEREISNGNGAFKGTIFLEYYHGVPVYACSTDGEGSSHDPAKEASNKVWDVAANMRVKMSFLFRQIP